jgi:predicted GH43/DUF377 family glycosyl hydrolase
MNFALGPLERIDSRLLVSPADVLPRFDGFEVIGTFNPAAVEFGKGVALLIRVAECPAERRSGHIALPCWDYQRGSIAINWMPHDEVEFIDPRIVRLRRTGHIRLTFVSWLLPAFSRDGFNIDQFGSPIFPSTRYETFGIEDARLTKVLDRYYFTYVAVSEHGIVTALASTKDFESIERHGIIFCPDNKDVVLFPEMIGGAYIAVHRPNGNARFSQPEIWLARSPDLMHWGRHERLWGNEARWASTKIGGGTPPIRTDRGWLSLYHGHIAPTAEEAARGEIGQYAAASMLQSISDPARVLAVSPSPVMVAETEFETSGYLPNIVFPTAMIRRDAKVDVYYGAADTVSGVARYGLDSLLAATASQ